MTRETPMTSVSRCSCRGLLSDSNISNIILINIHRAPPYDNKLLTGCVKDVDIRWL